MLTLRDLYEVNLGLAQPGAPISFYDVEKGIVSAAPVRPPAIIHNCDIENTLIGEGSVLHVRCVLRADEVSHAFILIAMVVYVGRTVLAVLC